MAPPEEHWTGSPLIHRRSIPLILALSLFAYADRGSRYCIESTNWLFESPGVDWYCLGLLFAKPSPPLSLVYLHVPSERGLRW